MNKLKLSYVTYVTFIQLIERLERKITASEIKYDYLISLQRGGALMSLILSDLLSLPIATLTISSYQNTEKKRSPIITQKISTDISGKKVLILDEICDSGETLSLATKHLMKEDPLLIHTATFYTKSHSTFIPTYSLEKNDDWIVLPYELRETSESVLMENIELKKSIKDFFRNCGYSDEFINKYENRK